MVKPIDISSIEKGSGILWSTWLEVLQPHKDASHSELARIAGEYMETHSTTPPPGWWGQSVAVAFEQHIGRRAPGQESDGSFTVTVSKTIEGTLDEVFEKWCALVEGETHFNSLDTASEPRISKTEKWRYWRVNLRDGSKVTVSVQSKPGSSNSSLIAVSQSALTEAASTETARTYWRQYLTKLS